MQEKNDSVLIYFFLEFIYLKFKIMSTLWLIILGGFLIVTDYTISKSGPIHLDLEHDPKLRKEVIYFDKIEFNDGYRVITRDSVVNYYKGKNEILWD